jgi:L-asparagine transporter-like permease
MQDADLFLSLAGIAGVFVGFGALISVRSGGASDAHEVAYMRAVVWMGLMAVVAALAPVTIGRYGITEHQVWALSSVLVLVGYWGMIAVSNLMPEVKADRAATSRTFLVVESAVSLLFAIPMILVPVAIMLGLLPEQEAALYFTVVVLILLMAGGALLELVYSQRRPATA